ncbi:MULTISPECIES: thioredoxin [Candidatus Ichthyocystis]|uniref:Thioredoxin n=1 Tax=Candidatus Ichthyocystis hellenicum TaxID=1561003 RepID=A0A0S4M4J9_9BURK|nr:MULTISPECIES: thioredoxin [Ichthyocystis]CUT17778.1 Thioredoxin [Candidatus Ichthyocystis hellenicum]
MSDLINVEDASDFEKTVLGSSIPVVVDFWAPWCGPCKMLTPLLEELSVSYSKKVLFVKVNVDDNKDLAAKYSVRGIPTIILFKNGEVESHKVGLLNKSQLATFIDSNI